MRLNTISFVDKLQSYDTFLGVAGIAQLVERCLAKAKVAGSSPVSRSKTLCNNKKAVIIIRST